MRQQGNDGGGAESRGQAVAPIFRLLGEGRLEHEAVDAVAAVLMADGLPTVPRSQLERACRIAYRPRPIELPSLTAGRANPLRRLMASLMVDLRPWALPVGVRSIGGGACRLLFAVDQYEVTVQGALGAPQRGHNVVGQILQYGDPVPSAAILLAGPNQRAETDADEDGSFGFRGIAEGSYELDVWAGNDLIVCMPVVLESRPAHL